jgi:hypothetical protein
MEYLELLIELAFNATACGDILVAAPRYWRTSLGLVAGIAATLSVFLITDSRAARILTAVHLPIAGLVAGVLWESRCGRLR